MSQVLGMDGKPKQPVGPTYHMRLCLVGSDDVDIKNVQTFGIAEDGFFMVKSHDNPKLPVFMTNPSRIQTVEVYKDGDKPLTKKKGAKSDDDFLLDLLKRNHATESKTQK